VASLSLKTMPWYGQIGVFAGISLVLAGAFWYFVESPKQVQLTAQAKELNAVAQKAGTETFEPIKEGFSSAVKKAA